MQIFFMDLQLIQLGLNYVVGTDKKTFFSISGNDCAIITGTKITPIVFNLNWNFNKSELFPVSLKTTWCEVEPKQPYVFRDYVRYRCQHKSRKAAHCFNWELEKQ